MNLYCAFYGNHVDVLQRMLDYDFICERDPSVKVIIVNDAHPKRQKVFFWDKELFIPQVNNREDLKQFGKIDVLINFASFRTAPTVIKEAMKTELFDWIFTVAEGIPERDTREIIALAKKYQIKLIGPSSVGWLFAGQLRVGNTWGSLDNLIKSKLHTKGSIGLISKSGGMMGEMCRVIAKETDGIHTALQIGWDRYPLTSFQDIALWYQDNPEIKMIVILGEVGNEDENKVADLIASGRITKPVIAWVVGTAAESFKTEVQFGHAWAKANADRETASFKNTYLRQAGAYVPESYDDFGTLIGQVFSKSAN